MSTINRGFTFTDGSPLQCSYTALHALVDNALVTNMAMSEFDATARVNQISATVPSADQGEGSTWFDTTLNIERVKSADGWHSSLLADVKNSTGATIPAGALVALVGSSSVSPVATYQWPKCAGILTATLTNGSRGLVLQEIDFARVRAIGPIAIGDTLVAAGGGVGPWSAFGTGFAVSRDNLGFTSVTAGIEIGMARGTIVGTGTGTVTALLFM
jgi:hypothetical protein